MLLSISYLQFAILPNYNTLHNLSYLQCAILLTHISNALHRSPTCNTLRYVTHLQSTYGYWPSVRSRWLDVGQVIYCASLWVSSHLDRTNLVNKGFIICELSGKFLLRGSAGKPERARKYLIMWQAPRAGKMNQVLPCDWLPERTRWGYLARSGIPAASRKKKFPESHIINLLSVDQSCSIKMAEYWPRSFFTGLNSTFSWFSSIRF